MTWLLYHGSAEVEGYYRIKGSTEFCIERAIAFAPYAVRPMCWLFGRWWEAEVGEVHSLELTRKWKTLLSEEEKGLPYGAMPST